MWPRSGTIGSYICLSLYAYAHGADPVDSLAEATPPPNSRDALMSFLQGADPLDPKAPQGGQGNPRDPKEPKGPKGPKAPQGALWGDGPMGPFGVIPKPFRMEGHFEWRVITSILAGLAQKYVEVVLKSIISKTLLGQARNA